MLNDSYEETHHADTSMHTKQKMIATYQGIKESDDEKDKEEDNSIQKQNQEEKSEQKPDEEEEESPQQTNDKERAWDDTKVKTRIKTVAKGNHNTIVPFETSRPANNHKNTLFKTKSQNLIEDINKRRGSRRMSRRESRRASKMWPNSSQDILSLSHSNSFEQDHKCLSKIKNLWDAFLFKPSSSFKIKWDLFIILLAIWNALTLPFEFAYPQLFEDNTTFNYFDHLIDVLFGIDVIINFRSAYRDSKTDELIMDPKAIAINYLKGRFWIDFLATLPLEYIALIFSENADALKIFQLFKLVRLLRLGRIVTYLKMNSSFKFGMKFVQLISMLLLTLHWIACVWNLIVQTDESWVPPRDEGEITQFYIYDIVQQYATLFYYALLIIFGEDMLPQTILQAAICTIYVIISYLIMGTIIGEFSNIMGQISKKANEVNEERDMIQGILVGLKIPEEIQTVVDKYYEEIQSAKFVRKSSIYDMLNDTLSNSIRLFQTESQIRKMGLFDTHNITQIESFAKNTTIRMFLEGEIIIKQGDRPNYFYFMMSGMAMIFLEEEDIMHLSYKQAPIYLQEIFNQYEKFDTPIIQDEDEIWNNQEQREEPSSDPNVTKSNISQLRRRSLSVKVPEPFSIKPYSIMNQNQSQSRNEQSKNEQSRNEQSRNEQSKSEQQGQNFDFFSITSEKDDYDIDEEEPISLKAIKMLQEGNYFGEISLLTNLKRTCSVVAASQTICGIIQQENFKELINTNADFKNRLMMQLDSYNDPYFKFLITMVRNVFAFRTVTSKILKSVVYLLKEYQAVQGSTVLSIGEYSEKSFFIKEGLVNVYMKDTFTDKKTSLDMSQQHNERDEKYILFAKLNKGSVFNFVSSFLQRPSIFRFVADKSTKLLVLEFSDFKNLIQRSETLNNVVLTVKSSYEKTHIKYDYGRMVYQNITQLLRIQKLKAQYEEVCSRQLSPKLSPKKSPLKHGLQTNIFRFSQADLSSLQKSVLSSARGKTFTDQKFDIIRDKFWTIAQKAKSKGFHISHMKVFSVIDSYYEKFVGKKRNIAVQNMMKEGSYTTDDSIPQKILQEVSGQIFNAQQQSFINTTEIDKLDTRRDTLANYNTQQPHINNQMNRSIKAEKFNSKTQDDISIIQGTPRNDLLLSSPKSKGLINQDLPPIQDYSQEQEKISQLLIEAQKNFKLINSMSTTFQDLDNKNQQKLDKIEAKLQKKLDQQLTIQQLLQSLQEESQGGNEEAKDNQSESSISKNLTQKIIELSQSLNQSNLSTQKKDNSIINLQGGSLVSSVQENQQKDQNFEWKERSRTNNTILNQSFYKSLDQENQAQISTEKNEDFLSKGTTNEKDFIQSFIKLEDQEAIKIDENESNHSYSNYNSLKSNQEDKSSLMKKYQKRKPEHKKVESIDQINQDYQHQFTILSNNNLSKQSGRIKAMNKKKLNASDSISISINASEIARKIKDNYLGNNNQKPNGQSFLTYQDYEENEDKEESIMVVEKLDKEDELRDQVRDLDEIDDNSLFLDMNKSDIVQKLKERINKKAELIKDYKRKMIDNSLDYSLRENN